MERERVRMPVGAVIACVLAITFLAALIIGLGILTKRLISAKNDIDRDASAVTTDAPAYTDTPTVTKAPNVTEVPFTTAEPSQSGTSVGNSKTDIIARCMSTVVSIDITVSSGSQSEIAGSGSGTIITNDGYIVTCNHVVEGAANIYVYLNDGSSYEATLIGNDPVTDIAVIKINADGVQFPSAVMGTSNNLLVGQSVYAIGNALGELSNTVTDGIISGLDRDIEINGQSMTLLQTSAAINSGNSGGALFLDTGELIGVVNAKTSGTTTTGASIEGLGFAVPIDLAKPIISDIMTYGFVTGRPYLGVSTKNVSYGYSFFNYTTYPQVVSIVEGSPADLAGIRENDIIVAINGDTISSSTALRVKINSFNVGDVITVTVLRGNNTYDIQVTLQERTQK